MNREIGLRSAVPVAFHRWNGDVGKGTVGNGNSSSSLWRGRGSPIMRVWPVEKGPCQRIPGILRDLVPISRIRVPGFISQSAREPLSVRFSSWCGLELLPFWPPYLLIHLLFFYFCFSPSLFLYTSTSALRRPRTGDFLKLCFILFFGAGCSRLQFISRP